ncbi:biotin-dependent carboxyltransferase family protein [Actinospica robiniae]|uniref:5-oxoprolinase subunit C family protein n=1 Tax=Actinospica robiniae TaxID=304901 RepID=UPI00040F979D|nr:biotin-dependent carboxyltransferase family protein [Actinospica robiniae]
MTTLEILAPGPLATIQDAGRPGLAALGVGRSGAADRASLHLANRLVGNPQDAAALELTLGGLRARADATVTLALTGAPCPARAGTRAVGMNSPIPLRPGDELVLGTPQQGARTYLAVRGGIETPEVLGSRSTDTLSGLGPPPLTAGTLLPIGDGALLHLPHLDQAPVRSLPTDTAEATLLRIVPGPRAHWFTPQALDLLCAGPYQVTAESNRIGARLDGPALPRAQSAELEPEGMALGSLQVPPHGKPVLLLADHPVTGGYPVIAVVLDDDVDRAAQLRPGDAVRFRTTPR